MPIAVCTYTTRFHTYTKDQVIEAYKKISAMGYDAVESPIGRRLMPVEEDLELLAKYNLKVCTVGGDLSKPDEIIKQSEQYNAKIIGLPAIPGNMMQSVDGFKAYAQQLNEMVKPFKGTGIVAKYHNHSQEFRNFPELNGKTGFDILVADTDPDLVTFQLDVHWASAAGCDPAAVVLTLKNRIPIIHFKDLAMDYNSPDVGLGFVPKIFAEVGQGNINWKPIVAACREAGVEWYSVEQDQSKRGAFESLKISIDYMRNELGL